MIQKHQPARMITAQEAVAISIAAGTIDSAEIAREISEEYARQKPVHEGDVLFWHFCLQAAIYDAGRMQGIREQRAARRLPAVRGILTNESPEDKAQRRAAARALVELTDYTPITDVDTAAVIYETARAAYPTDPLVFLLGRVFFAGKIAGQRQRRKA